MRRRRVTYNRLIACLSFPSLLKSCTFTYDSLDVDREKASKSYVGDANILCHSDFLVSFPGKRRSICCQEEVRIVQKSCTGMRL